MLKRLFSRNSLFVILLLYEVIHEGENDVFETGKIKL